MQMNIIVRYRWVFLSFLHVKRHLYSVKVQLYPLLGTDDCNLYLNSTESILGRVSTEMAQLYLPLSPHAQEQKERWRQRYVPFLLRPDLVYSVELGYMRPPLQMYGFAIHTRPVRSRSSIAPDECSFWYENWCCAYREKQKCFGLEMKWGKKNLVLIFVSLV